MSIMACLVRGRLAAPAVVIALLGTSMAWTGAGAQTGTAGGATAERPEDTVSCLLPAQIERRGQLTNLGRRQVTLTRAECEQRAGEVVAAERQAGEGAEHGDPSAE